MAQLTPTARRRRRDILVASLAAGRPVDADVLAVVMAVKAEREDVAVECWTSELVWEMLWIDIAAWCERNGFEVPEGCPEALWALINHLADEKALVKGSESRRRLLTPLVETGGLDQNGSRRHPSARCPAS